MVDGTVEFVLAVAALALLLAQAEALLGHCWQIASLEHLAKPASGSMYNLLRLDAHEHNLVTAPDDYDLLQMFDGHPYLAQPALL